MYPGLTDPYLGVSVVTQSDLLYTSVHILVMWIKIIILGFGQVLFFSS